MPGRLWSMAWPVEVTAAFEAWYSRLEDADREAVNAAVDTLEDRGPGLGRPLVGAVTGSRHGHLKELRIGTIRILFRFDPRRTAILLLGGDKRGECLVSKGHRCRRRSLRPLLGRTRRGRLASEEVIDMAGHRAWREVRRGDDSSPEAQAYRSAIGDALALAEIRARRGLTQVDVARVLRTSQASVSKIERRDDLYLSTLRSFVEARGGGRGRGRVFTEGRIAISAPREDPTSGHAEIRKDPTAGFLAAEPM